MKHKIKEIFLGVACRRKKWSAFYLNLAKDIPMKKSALFLVLCLPVIIFFSCNKSDKEPDGVGGYYQGETHARYRYQRYDPLLDSLIREEWDTVYTDYIIVGLDHTAKKIKFTINDVVKAKVRWKDKVSEYDYTDEMSYVTIYSTHDRQYFTFKPGDSLGGAMDSYSGTGGDYIQLSITFAGKKAL